MTSLERIQAISNHLSRMTKDTNGAYFEPDGTHVPMAGDVAFLVEAFGKMRKIAIGNGNGYGEYTEKAEYFSGDQLKARYIDRTFEEAMAKVTESKR